MNTIILADDHNVVREALRLLLQIQPDFQVVAETGDGLHAVQLVEKYRPDILIVDIVMPGFSGIEVARQAKRVSPATHVIVLSMYDTEAYVVEALQAGASGYVLKKSNSQELVYAIRQVLSGNLHLSPPINERAIGAYLQRADESRIVDAYESLTLREREVLQLAAQGFSNPQIAGKLSISARTVEMHRANLKNKLGLKTQTELVVYAVKKGLLE